MTESTPEEIEAVVMDRKQGPYLRELALEDRRLAPELAGKLAEQIALDKTEPWVLRFAALRNPNIRLSALKRVADDEDDDSDVRQVAVQVLAGDIDGMSDVIFNWDGLSPEELAAVVKNEGKDWTYRQYALKHKNLPADMASTLAADIAVDGRQDWSLRATALQHQHLSPEDAARVTGQIATNKKDSMMLREEAMASPHLPPEAAAQIALDKEQYMEMRYAALEHKNLPADVSFKIAADPNEDSGLRILAVSQLQPPWLVAAAPELLAACEWVSSILAQDSASFDALHRTIKETLDAAIAKAKGLDTNKKQS